jgi:PAS domain S-box-containing protein
MPVTRVLIPCFAPSFDPNRAESGQSEGASRDGRYQGRMRERADEPTTEGQVGRLDRFRPGSPVLAGRLAALLFVASGALGLATVPLQQPAEASRPGIAAVALGAIAVGLICWKIPWSRLPAATTLLIAIPAFALVDAIGIVGRDPFMFTLFFVIAYVQVGITQRRWVPVAILPLTVTAFLIPPLLLDQDALAGDVFAIVPISAALAEALAWFTDRFVAAERERRDAQDRYRMLVERSPAPIYVWVVDAEGSRFEFLSPQLEGILGYQPEDWITDENAWLHALHPDDRGRVLDADATSDRTGEPLRTEYRLRTTDGRWIWVRDVAVLIEGDPSTFTRWLGVFTDITETKEAQAALETSERRYRVLFQSAPDPVWVYDAESLRFLDVNDAAVRRYGYSRDEFLAMTLRDLLPRGDPLAFSGTSRHRTNGGDILEVEMLSSSVEVAGVDSARLLLAHDMTTQKRTASELRKTVGDLRRSDLERQRLLSRLIRAQEEERKKIALDLHDDPIQKMAALAIRLDLLRATGDPTGEKLDKITTTVRDTIASLRHLMFQVRPSSLDRGGLAVALQTYLDQQASMHPDTRYELENEMTDEPPEDHRVVLYRVTQEALSNVGRHAEASAVRVVLVEVDGGYGVLIEDDGVGFAGEDTEDSPAGHLGVTAMREQAEQIGGWLQIRSRQGVGTMVRCWVPAAGAVGEGAEPAA